MCHLLLCYLHITAAKQKAPAALEPFLLGFLALQGEFHRTVLCFCKMDIPDGVLEALELHTSVSLHLLLEMKNKAAQKRLLLLMPVFAELI